MISTTAEYALRAVVFLAREGDRARTTAEIATATRVPAGYLSKVLQLLVRTEVLQSVMGKRGGYRVARPPAELTTLAVINSVDPIRRIRSCPLGLGDHATRLCPLHRRLDSAAALAEQAFAETTIGDLLAEADATGECHFPQRPHRVRSRRRTGEPSEGPARQAAPRGARRVRARSN